MIQRDMFPTHYQYLQSPACGTKFVMSGSVVVVGEEAKRSNSVVGQNVFFPEPLYHSWYLSIATTGNSMQEEADLHVQLQLNKDHKNCR